MTSRWSTSTRRAYVGWLTLAGARALPRVERQAAAAGRSSGPFDYENEIYTTSLWIAGRVHVVLRAPAGPARRAHDTAGAARRGRLQTSASCRPRRAACSSRSKTASFDAWIKHYRPDENSPNSSISYYTKGAVIGLLLDARIRAATTGAKSLDDVMRLALTRLLGRARSHRRRLPPARCTRSPARTSARGGRRSSRRRRSSTTTKPLEWLGLRFAPVDPPASVAEGRGGRGSARPPARTTAG